MQIHILCIWKKNKYHRPANNLTIQTRTIQRNRILYTVSTFEIHFQIEWNDDFRCRLKEIYDYDLSQILWLVTESYKIAKP